MSAETATGYFAHLQNNQILNNRWKKVYSLIKKNVKECFKEDRQTDTNNERKREEETE